MTTRGSEVSVGRPLVSPAHVGRARELDLLVAAALRTPAVVTVEGEAGIGKTRLVTELASRPELAGHRIVTGGCREIREPFPLGPVLEVVRNLGDAVAPVRCSPVTGALRPLLPELAELLPPSPAPLDDRVAERHRVFRALLEVLRVPGSMTVVLEDLHWADEHTVDFIRYALGDPPGALSWVLTFRGEDAGPGVRALAARLPASVNRTQLVLSPLDVEQTGELAAAIVAVERVAGDFAAYLSERTGGLPFAIEEVMALLRERGVVGDLESRGLRALAERAVPAAVRDHVRERVGRLPERAQSLLEALAVLQRPATGPQLAAVSGQRPPEVAAGLSRAIRSGLLTEDGETVGFRHMLAAQSVYEGIPGPRRRELHDRAAEALRQEGGQLLGRVAHHLRQAGRLEEWVPVAEQVADQAIALGHDDEAARLLEEVLGRVRLAPEVAGRVAVKLGRAASQMLSVVDVTDLLSAVLRQELPRTQRGELQIVLGALLDRTDFGAVESRVLFREAVDNVSDRPDLKAWAMVALEMRNAPEVTLAQRSERLHQVLEILPSVEDPDVEISLLGQVGRGFMSLGEPTWRDLAARVEERTGGMPTRRRPAGAYENLGSAACYMGHYQTAEGFLRAARAGAEVCENERLRVMCRSAQALLHYFRGRWDGLDAEVAPLLEQLAEHPRFRTRIELVSSNLALARGDLDEARRGLTGAVTRFSDGDGDVLPLAVGSLVRLFLSQGEVDAAVEQAERYLAGTARHIIWPAIYRCLPWLAEALTAAGRVTDAATLVSRCAYRLRGSDAPLAPAALRHSRGFIAAAGDDPAGAVRHFLAAARHYASVPAPYEAALANEAAAQAAVAAGRGDGVAAPLAAALATYADLGATRDLARAARAARKHGVPVPSRHRGGRRGYGDALSPRERDAAELAATGLTNKEIASALFVSVDTVKKHLKSAMRKLDVSSRTALARRLPPAAPER